MQSNKAIHPPIPIYDFYDSKEISRQLDLLYKKRQKDIGKRGSTGTIKLYGAYKFLRPQQKLAGLGDYTILSGAIMWFKRHNVSISTKDINRTMFRYSEEFSDSKLTSRKEILNNLVSLSE